MAIGGSIVALPAAKANSSSTCFFSRPVRVEGRNSRVGAARFAAHIVTSGSRSSSTHATGRSITSVRTSGSFEKLRP